MSAAMRAVAAARGAVGSRFRLHGREPALGLDCVGLVLVAMRAAGWRGAAPADYPLRGETDAAALLDTALVRVDEAQAGDVVLFAAGPGQLHLGIATDVGLVHADAGLRHVVERPGPAPWPVLGRWRVGEN